MQADCKMPQDQRAEVDHFKGKVGALPPSRTDADPELVEARRNLKAAHLASDVERAVNAFPPLTDEQLSSIALLLRPVIGGGVA